MKEDQPQTFGEMHSGSDRDFDLTSVWGAELLAGSEEGPPAVVLAVADYSDRLLIQMDLTVAMELLGLLENVRRANGSPPAAWPPGDRIPNPDR